MLFELEGEPERVIKAGEAFWEPGGDVIHYQDGNNRTESWSRFLVTMMCTPGQPMLTLVDDEELAQRKDRRARIEADQQAEHSCGCHKSEHRPVNHPNGANQVRPMSTSASGFENGDETRVAPAVHPAVVLVTVAVRGSTSRALYRPSPTYLRTKAR
ncbi:hypothetical protein [Streptomyces albiflavescens]